MFDFFENKFNGASYTRNFVSKIVNTEVAIREGVLYHV